jgi:hypothetical protein
MIIVMFSITGEWSLGKEWMSSSKLGTPSKSSGTLTYPSEDIRARIGVRRPDNLVGLWHVRGIIWRCVKKFLRPTWLCISDLFLLLYGYLATLHSVAFVFSTKDTIQFCWLSIIVEYSAKASTPSSSSWGWWTKVVVRRLWLCCWHLRWISLMIFVAPRIGWISLYFDLGSGYFGHA